MNAYLLLVAVGAYGIFVMAVLLALAKPYLNSFHVIRMQKTPKKPYERNKKLNH